MDPHNPYTPPLSNSDPPASNDGEQQLASRWLRLGASIIDGLAVSAINIPLMWITGYWTRAMAEAQAHRGFFQPFKPEQLLWAAVGLAILIAINWSFLQQGQTIGKRLLNIRIVRKDGSPISAQRIITHRLLPVHIGTQLPLVGRFFILLDCLLIFRPGHNTLHDDIADTKVILVPKI